MKQHITREQLAEITLQEANKLSELLGYSEENKLVYQQIPYIITIGKMIEIIANKEYYFCIDEVGITIFDESQDEYVSFDNEELTDALWEAVKFVLEENDK